MSSNHAPVKDLPVVSSNNSQEITIKRKDKKSDASTGTKAAGIRAVIAQLVTFYFRAPIKSFFRSRLE
jgi:1-aminocyclopropane-1-carboxylate deaminase/D-cysteine desulfhydrase-like pyridoxal-dependent ACC family enzyme